jgi:hypothetical protein
MAGWQKRKITDAMNEAFGAGANDSGYREGFQNEDVVDSLRYAFRLQDDGATAGIEYPGMAASPSLDDEIVDAEIVEDES